MREPKRVILELLVIAAVGTAAGITANAMNPRGLKLSRDYFQVSEGVPLPATKPAPAASQTVSTALDPYAGLAAEIRAKLEHFGLSPIRQEAMKALFQDPAYASGLYMIIDAREDADYAGGHIPGAFHLYYYQEEQYANNVVPLAPGAEKVIVYCNGGDCEDSVLTAVLLRDKYAIDPAKILVYPEGFEAWQKAGLAVEKGERNSGDIVQASQPAAGGK